MTSVWGPLGWMTLHSAASLYPDTPTEAEMLLMTKWLDNFKNTITCPSCQGHFAELLTNYRAQFPNMMYSRRNFMLFTLRAHNAVNRRINKPVYPTVQACFDLLRKNVQYNKSNTFRITYINHIMRYWRTYQDASGIAALKRVQEMQRIEIEYMAPRSNEFEIMIPEDTVMIQFNSEGAIETQRPVMRSALAPRMVMTATGFRLRR
jgi:hypothetical protein